MIMIELEKGSYVALIPRSLSSLGNMEVMDQVINRALCSLAELIICVMLRMY